MKGAVPVPSSTQSSSWPASRSRRWHLRSFAAPGAALLACSGKGGCKALGGPHSCPAQQCCGALLGRDKCSALGELQLDDCIWKRSHSPSPARQRGRRRIKAKMPSHLAGLEQQMKGGHWEPGIMKGEPGKFGSGRDFWLVGFPLRNSLCLFHDDEAPFNFFLPPFSSPSSFPLSPG